MSRRNRCQAAARANDAAIYYCKLFLVVATVVVCCLRPVSAGTVTLAEGASIGSKFGWKFGNVPAKSSQTFNFYSTGSDLLIHFRPYDVDSDTELRVILNGQLLGYLPTGKNKKYAPRTLFYLPVSHQVDGKNVLRVIQQNSGQRWGLAEVGLFRANSGKAMFGNLRPLGKDTRHIGRVLLRLPLGMGDSQLALKFYDVDNDEEVLLRADYANMGNAAITPNNQWGDIEQIYLPANTHLIEIDNTFNGPKKLVWGVKVVSVTPLDAPGAAPSEPFDGLGFDIVSDAEWDDVAVRKVLQTFAWGGQPSDEQIELWAAMSPDAAIVEMLNFEQHNTKLSPLAANNRDRMDKRANTLSALSAFWRSNHPRNGTPKKLRYRYEIGSRNYYLWTRAALARGLNPFRHKIGLWETNYHMAVNMATEVNAEQMIRYYDDIMFAHERNKSYEDVIAVAAKSAAVATQYQHRRNRYRNGVCECNEDFAREFYQLFFGILGEGNTEYHETTTIKNMALSLTDMRVDWSSSLRRLPETVSFGTAEHYDGTVEMLGSQINGSTARERIDAVSDYAIAHWESNQNLPVKIIGDLADDNLDDTKKAVIRAAWANMAGDDKNLLRFLRAYAVSTQFHDASRVKYWTSFDRHLNIANRLVHNNREHYLERYNPARYFSGEEAQVFYPTHNVFGNQRASEAAASSLVFMKNYNLWVGSVSSLSRASGTDYDVEWEKNWGDVIPVNGNGEHVVTDVAEWLWQHVVGDGLANFGIVERAHMYALLGDSKDLMFLLDENDLDRVVTADDVTADPDVSLLVAELGSRTLDLRSNNRDDRRQANQDVGEAFAFIAVSPYVFGQLGR